MKPASRWSAERGGAWCAGYILAMLGAPGGTETVGRTKGHSKGVTRRPLGMPASQPAARASDTAAHAGSAHPTPVAQVLGAGAATGFEGRQATGHTCPLQSPLLQGKVRGEVRSRHQSPGAGGPGPAGTSTPGSTEVSGDRTTTDLLLVHTHGERGQGPGGRSGTSRPPTGPAEGTRPSRRHMDHQPRTLGSAHAVYRNPPMTEGNGTVRAHVGKAAGVGAGAVRCPGHAPACRALPQGSLPRRHLPPLPWFLLVLETSW